MKKRVAITLSIFVFFFVSCDKPLNQKPNIAGEMNYESLVQEKDSPLLFMDVEAKIRNVREETDNPSIFLYGTISNTAMNTKFKDVVLLVKYYSVTNDLIETAEFVVYKFFEPNTRTKFELNVHPPNAMRTFDIEVKDARATN